MPDVMQSAVACLRGVDIRMQRKASGSATDVCKVKSLLERWTRRLTVPEPADSIADLRHGRLFEVASGAVYMTLAVFRLHYNKLRAVTMVQYPASSRAPKKGAKVPRASGIRVHGIRLQRQGLSGEFMPVIPQDIINITVEEVSKIGDLLKPAE